MAASLIHGPAQLFLTAMGMEMVGQSRGQRHLADHLAKLAVADGEMNAT